MIDKYILSISNQLNSRKQHVKYPPGGKAEA